MGGQHYLPLTEEHRQEMLRDIGVKSVEELFSDIPAERRLKGTLNLPPAFFGNRSPSSPGSLADKNKTCGNMPAFRCGNLRSFYPGHCQHITARSEFYTFLHALSGGSKSRDAAIHF